MNNNKIFLFSVFLGNQYNHYVPFWIKYTAQLFYPGQCDVFIFTDNYEDNKKYEVFNTHIIEFKTTYKNRNECLVNKLNWLSQLVNNYAQGYSRVAFIQSNVYCSNVINSYNLYIPDDKLIISKHAMHVMHNFNSYKHSFLKQQSKFYLPSENYPIYVQACLILGSTDIFKKMIKECQFMQSIDLQSNYYAPWQDESYINRWVADNQDLVNIQCLMTAVNSYNPGIKELFNVLNKQKLNNLQKPKLIKLGRTIRNLLTKKL